jgi:hypothetical protein
MTDFLLAQILSPLQLRAELEAMVRRDLLGPAGGPEEDALAPKSWQHGGAYFLKGNGSGRRCHLARGQYIGGRQPAHLGGR